MALLKVYNLEKAEVDSFEVADEVFAAEVNQNLFYEVVKMQLANTYGTSLPASILPERIF